MAKKLKTLEGVIKRRSTTMASKDLGEYLMKHNLDPDKDWTKDPVHGPIIKKLMQEVRTASKLKLHKTHVKQDEAKERKAKAKERAEKSLAKPKEKIKPVTKQPSVYDYPEVDGKPMSSELRKKFRGKMRRLLKANMDTRAAEKKALEFLGMNIAATAQPKKTEKLKKQKKEMKKRTSKQNTEL